MSCFRTSLLRRKGRIKHTNIRGLSRRDVAWRLSFISALAFGGGWSLFRDWTSDLAQGYCCYSKEPGRQQDFYQHKRFGHRGFGRIDLDRAGAHGKPDPGSDPGS